MAEQKDTLVSIISPIYGVEKFIKKFAISLFEQSYSHIEYIFVNDCTQDNSLFILKDVINQYPQRKAMVTIVNKEKNEGLPQARKTGMQYAHGDYIMHLDSDDWVDNNMVTEMLEVALSSQADIVYADNFIESTSIRYRSNPTFINSIDFLKAAFYMQVSAQTWSKLYKAELFKKARIIYPTANMHEDLCINLQLFAQATSIKHLPKAFYHYRLNPNSLTQNYNVISATENLRTMWNYITINNLDDLKKPCMGFANYIKSMYCMHVWPHNKKLFKELWNICPLSDKYIFSWNPTLRKKYRLYLYLLQFIHTKMDK